MSEIICEFNNINTESIMMDFEDAEKIVTDGKKTNSKKFTYYACGLKSFSFETLDQVNMALSRFVRYRLPQLFSRKGIITSKFKDEAVLPCDFKRENPECMKVVNDFNRIWDCVFDWLLNTPSVHPIIMSTLDIKKVTEDTLKVSKMFTLEKDKSQKEVENGRIFKYFSLTDYEGEDVKGEKVTSKTEINMVGYNITDTDGKKKPIQIDYTEILDKGVGMNHITDVGFSRLKFAAGKISLKMKVKSIVIVSLIDPEENKAQHVVVKKYENTVSDDTKASNLSLLQKAKVSARIISNHDEDDDTNAGEEQNGDKNTDYQNGDKYDDENDKNNKNNDNKKDSLSSKDKILDKLNSKKKKLTEESNI